MKEMVLSFQLQHHLLADSQQEERAIVYEEKIFSSPQLVEFLMAHSTRFRSLTGRKVKMADEGGKEIVVFN